MQQRLERENVMNHKPIVIKNISLLVNQKTCFNDFSTQIHPGTKIVIMGPNGAGKSTLLKIIQGIVEPSQGRVIIPSGIIFGFVPQTITDYPQLSGGQRFNKALSQALSINPDILCLDEPTNHLDLSNKRSLALLLRSYKETLIVVSHDPDILTLDFDEIWNIEHGIVSIFRGNYNEYLKEKKGKQLSLERKKEQLHKEKRGLRKSVQLESRRAARSKSANKNEKDRNLLGTMKESGSRSTGKSLKRLSKIDDKIQQHLVGTFIHKSIEPRFNLDARKLSSSKALVSVVNGACGYDELILHNISIQVLPKEHIAIIGNNGTGKSTFLKALLNDPSILKQGEWVTPLIKDIGYLDQHYSSLNQSLTVFETIKEIVPEWSDAQVRKQLNDFLFRTQEEVTNKVNNLSGGEKARLTLASIAAQSPQLLLLDEITNNVDIETRKHIIEVLKAYPGAMIIISHDIDFLTELGVLTIYETKNVTMNLIDDLHYNRPYAQ